ncbi:hypothetical protein FZI85_29970 [Mycobacterium sp. CBMA293]|uniref:hypothetical protein n=1 Tax=unclassified Mycolicibacterium TaxID=2636767 RepID=UPI0012DC7A6A|nr:MULTISPECIES: hypothetical protein [unclassified Mycolicibacterium]MUL50064.1 hypothetical protein [Mycolicibacterium sp. CBMA 360]MUL62735.1 hypothetical protein [Mycolicibacterium sp. CBMA 335]MUL69620.1 hypothetical protein [Mycolicibacterium sp. CBMA 311]MUL97406.1 hypothetical protein [Mycolicibacterium sp. CBMA 230]MUM15220.1 hypothetical protein [Mycolicibacterium sp. CBMA 293]
MVRDELPLAPAPWAANHSAAEPPIPSSWSTRFNDAVIPFMTSPLAFMADVFASNMTLLTSKSFSASDPFLDRILSIFAFPRVAISVNRVRNPSTKLATFSVSRLFDTESNPAFLTLFSRLVCLPMTSSAVTP